MIWEWTELSKHFAKIYCKKKVIFYSLNVGEIIYIGRTIKVVPSLISSIQVRKCVVEGANAYLLMLVEEPIKSK